MKSFLFIALATCIIACNLSEQSEKEINYTGFSERKVLLIGYDKNHRRKDTIATLFIKIPDRLDTFYQWTHWSDCASCGNVKYRFADKKYNQFAEKGWYWTYKPDSVYQLSIWHNPVREVPDSMNLLPIQMEDTGYYYWFQNNLYCRQVKYLSKKLKNINGRSFFIANLITPCGYVTDSATLYLIATTNLKKKHLFFIAECGAKDTTGFIDNMYKSFVSIKISESQ